LAETADQPDLEPGEVEPAAPLMEDIAEGAAAGAFAALASQVGPGPADHSAQQITPVGRTIEDHVLEMLRPMLREWLDKHLPQMVQRLVQRELDRIIHRSDPV
jgi:cell pole-organizing protein PopZ